MIKMTEIVQLPLEELKIRLRDAEEELANVKMQHALRQLDNVVKIRYLRRDVARLKTIIHEHETGKRGAKPAQT
jgi:large subunit ribosomal protein L29